MKNQKGITLMALTIYVIIFMLVIGIVSTITSYFYNNVMGFDETTKSYSEINKFNMYFLQDLKANAVISNFIKEGEENIGITLYNPKNYETSVYKFEKNAIYRNGVLICKNIKDVNFEIKDETQNMLNVTIETEGKASLVKKMTYSINN